MPRGRSHGSGTPGCGHASSRTPPPTRARPRSRPPASASISWWAATRWRPTSRIHGSTCAGSRRPRRAPSGHASCRRMPGTWRAPHAWACAQPGSGTRKGCCSRSRPSPTFVPKRSSRRRTRWRMFNRRGQEEADRDGSPVLARPTLGRRSSSGTMYADRVRQMRKTATQRARRARRQVLLLLPLIAAVILAFRYREQLFGLDVEVRIGAVIALVILGWAFARDLGRALGPILFKRLDAGTAGTVGFLIRLATLGTSVIVALQLAGLHTRTLAVGGAITAVIFGLAAQQTLGNLIAGTVLLSARPFRVSDRIRLQAGPLAGQVEGTVVSLGLLYTTLAHGEDRIMVPNNVVLSSAVVPLREPAAVDLRARLDADVKPTQIEELLEQRVTVPTRQDPHIDLEELDGDEVVLRVSATPVDRDEGAQLADEVLAVLGEVREG